MNADPTIIPIIRNTEPKKVKAAASSLGPRQAPLLTLTASAQRLTGRDVDKNGKSSIVGRTADWQNDAWDLYDLVGEQRFLASTLAGRMSQAGFYVGKITEGTDTPERDDNALANDLLSRIGGGDAGLSQIIQRLALNLWVAGDGWLVGYRPEIMEENYLNTDKSSGVALDPTELDWKMLSVSEVSKSMSGSVTLQIEESRKVEAHIDDLWLVRVWRPHPRRSWEADSPTRASLPVLRELVGLTMHISAQVDSRLAGAGVFLVPQSAQQALRAAAGLDEEEGDQFTEALMEAMMTPIGDRGAASAVVPLVVTVPDEAADSFRHITFSSDLDGEARELRDEAIRRLALGQDAPPELLLGTGCVDTGTEILTRRGWQVLDTLREDDEILTMNPDTGLSQWQRPSGINVFERVDEPMLRMQGKGHSSLTTMNHRWLTTSANHDRREFVTSDSLNTGHRIPTAAPHADVPSEAKFSDAFVELVGWFWTEGHYSLGTEDHSTEPYVDSLGRVYANGHSSFTGRWGQATISQSVSANPGRVDRIRRALDECFPAGWGTETRQSGEWGSAVVRFNLRKEVHEALAQVGGKHVDLAFVQSLTAAQLELFIRTSCDGDGWHNSDGRLDIWQKDPQALDAYEHALILSGRTATRTQHAGGWVVNAHQKSTVRPIKAGIESEETYTGTVWCPTVENGTWMARRDGTTWFTGNSMNHWGAWLVREDVVTTHLEPPLALICDALTTQYLWPALVESGMSEEAAREFVIWYDVSDLVARPNRSEDAKALHLSGALSDEALRRETGFDETDAPEQEDDLASTPEVDMAIDLARTNPSLFSAPGLPSIVAQIKKVLEGESTEADMVPISDTTATPSPAPTSPVPAPDTVPSAVTSDAPEGA